MKRISLLLTVFAAFAFFMVSCGGSESPKAEETAVPEVAQAEEVQEPAAEETTEAVAYDIEAGKAIYDKACFACHAAGVAGAAKLDDKARWEVTAAKGLTTVQTNSINGFTGEYGVMPPKGGNTTFTDDEVKNAVAYMLSEAGVVAE